MPNIKQHLSRCVMLKEQFPGYTHEIYHMAVDLEKALENIEKLFSDENFIKEYLQKEDYRDHIEFDYMDLVNFFQILRTKVKDKNREDDINKVDQILFPLFACVGPVRKFDGEIRKLEVEYEVSRKEASDMIDEIQKRFTKKYS